jgi:4-hydroxy-2-oxoheptanedioate aldolase
MEGAGRESLAARIRRGETVLAIGVSVFDPAVMELVALAGFDVAVLDACQTLWAPERVREMLYAAQTRHLPVIVRVSGAADAASVLNFGVAGVMFDQVQTVAQAREIVRICKYAPLGQRGLSARGRAKGYGTLPIAAQMQRENDDVMVIVQIEDREGMQNMEGIVRVPGIDAVSGGRNDLAQSLGVAGQPRHPSVMAAEETISRCVRAAGLPMLLVASTPEEARTLIEQGTNFLSIGQDTDLFFDALRQKAQAYSQRMPTNT